ncbi:uncharacterized protein C8A04DRAFT_39194 [Dichotomopilus funicola]|uniref:SWR1-complex protein 3 domain-containing protein n=1 Tax=Dichotomopilus funicola TaxID=1934379 RepID=A0AAN6UYC6_9PEZI|nr:hypothetical protein C8A04DRAFT_39194 [Dichotomopilus funicola]
MERKRKLPARAAARAEQAAKRRTMTPPQRSVTPAPAPTPVPEPEPTPIEEPPAPLPKTISAGKPLPTVDSPQPDDLSLHDFQTVTESGVLSESLSRSRSKWTMEGTFEKYWTKPIKKRGQIIEEPNNPPKESMVKIGQVTITVEPHVFEATMYAVKDPKPHPPPTPERPVMQYGPPNGSMPPPPTPQPKAMAPTTVPASPSGRSSTPSLPQAPGRSPILVDTKPPFGNIPAPAQAPAPSVAQPSAGQSTPDPIHTPHTGRPMVSPRGMEAVLSPATTTPTVAHNSPGPHAPPPKVTPPPNHQPPPNTTTAGFVAPYPRPGTSGTNSAPQNGTPTTPAGAAAKPGGALPDPIILMLAERAGTDPQLRDLMKRVAVGDAAKHELERFQAVIDALTAESKRNGNTSGPSADRLLVDGKTVRYFADEVRAILDIVLSSNPNQTSADLRPPVGSDTLVVTLVKAALDDHKLRDMVRRIAENRTQFSDATDLKAILDRLRTQILKDKERQQTQSPVPPSPSMSRPQGVPNGHAAPSPTTHQSPVPQTALRSKGPPPPPPKPDISAVVFEFTGGNGDRYLFPKFSLLEYVPVSSGQQVIASFLIVRKGSKAEYPMADPDLDYYQPLTVRLFTPVGRHLENLARVVAPPDEVRRYMDDIMHNMTRAEYILLAMRLPRRDGTEDEANDNGRDSKPVNGGLTKEKENGSETLRKTGLPPPSVLWTTKAAKPDVLTKAKGLMKSVDAEEQQYQNFISSVSRKEV